MGRPRILVIDDEREFREAIAQALGLDGYEVDTARDGSEGRRWSADIPMI
jgi:DNA-binding response OmpR family regulator